MEPDEIIESVNHLVNAHEQNNLNSELRDILIDNLFSKGSNNYNNIYGDIDNFNSYINKYIKNYLNYNKGILIESLIIYKDVKDSDLRNFLIINYYDMKIHYDSLDILEFSRKLYIQIEACLNYAIIELDAFEKIKKNPEKYVQSYQDKKSGEYIINSFSKGWYSFFQENGHKKEINSINNTAKLNFVFMELKIKNGYDFNIWKQIKDNRNEASHGLKKDGYRKFNNKNKISNDDKKNEIDKYYDFFFYKILNQLNCLMR